MKKIPVTIIYRGKCRGELRSPIQVGDLHCWQNSWRPKFDELARINGSPEPDEHWRWDQFPVMNEDGVNFSAAVVVDGETQGLAWAARGHFSQRPVPLKDRIQAWIRFSGSPPPEEILCIERLATHPGNRGAPSGTFSTQYKLVGDNLMRWAVELAFELGLSGRVGLHALPEARSWYRRLGMTRIRKAAKDGMEYFEFSPEAAREFLKP